MESKILIRAILLSFLPGFLLIFSLHFLGEWEQEKGSMPENSVSPNNRITLTWNYSVETWDNICLLLNDKHSTVVREDDKSEIRNTFSNIKFRKSFDFTIFEHFRLLFLVSILITPFTYRLLRR